MPTYVDYSYLDVAFDKDPHYHFGHVEDPETGTYASARFSDALPVMTRREIETHIERLDASKEGLEYAVTRIHDQDGIGQCVADATGQAHEQQQCLQFGPDRVIHLSAASLYNRRIGSGPNSGARISDALSAMTAGDGILPLDNETNRRLFGNLVMKNYGYSLQRPTGWEIIARQFKFHEHYVLRSVDEMLTASILSFSIVVGRRGHSICYSRPTKDQRGNIVMAYPNSWSLNWGQPFGNMTGGFGFDSLSMISAASGYCWAVRTAIVPSHIQIPPAPAPETPTP